MARIPSGELWLSTCLCQAFLLSSMVCLSNGLSGSTFNEFRFSEQPLDTITVKDQPTVLACSAQHDGSTPEIQWIKDEVYITPDSRRQILSNGSLYFQIVEHSRSHRPDEGIYQCAASVTGLGTIVSKKAKLQIASLNKAFNEEPQSLSVHLQDTAMFACDIGGTPPPTVRWYKDELEIDTQNVNYHIHIGGVLEIRNTQFATFGRYKCKAENPERSRISEVAELTQDSDVATYKGVPPHFVMEPKDTVAVEGDITMLFCAANGRDREVQPPTITWLKDGVTIDMSNLDTRFSVVGQGSLRIDSVNEGDSGSYTCRATNMEDSVDSDITLTVQVPPKFRKRPKSVLAQIHTTVVFECDIYGVPKPNIYWLKNGDIVIPSDYFQIVDGRNLRILGLVNSDDGMYQCVAENEVGNVQASAQLSIQQLGASVSPPPFPSMLTTSPWPNPSGIQNAASHSLPSKPQDLTAAYISTRFITLSWRQPADPGNSDIDSYAVFWREEGSNRERVMNTTAMEANIQQLKPSTRYEFKVLAHNGAGASTEVAQITVQTEQEVHVPGPALNLEASVLSPTSIKLTWQTPSEPHGIITNYKLLYYEVGNPNGDVDMNTESLEEVITGLKKSKQYSFRVVAYNNNGPGTSTEEILSRTFSDVPDLPPQNVTIETDSSTSLIIRWEPPPEDAQNGIITGYKIRYKQRGARGGDTATTDGNRRVYELTDLEKGKEYSIRLQALNVNGSSPATSWLAAETYISDLEETTVPGKPTSLRVRPMVDSIVVSWTAPEEQDIMIRGYILGYGIRMPDVFRQVLDSKQRSHIIKNLQPSSEYVISLRAYNNKGEGLQIYETTFTREETTPEPQTPMIPPVGLKAIVLSSVTIVLTWSDTSLGRNQRIADNRYYTIRYNQKMARKFKYLNATDLNVHIDDLKPNTEYEFSVKVTKGRRKSTWSLSVFNKTFEDAPATAPRDLTPVPVQGKPTWVTLNWQPPRQPNGQVTGYLVYYSTDPNQNDRDWVVEGVMGGDRLSATIRDLSSDTTYFFKVQARNSKGYGPMSPTVIFRTPKADGTGGGMIETPDDIGRVHTPGGKHDQYDQDGYGAYGRTTPGRKDEKSGSPAGIPSLVLWISIGCVGGITLIAVLVVTIIVCKRRSSNNSHKGYQPANKKGTPTKPGPKDLKPPDLWIHDNMELKNLDKSNSDSQQGKSAEDAGMGMERRPNSFISDRERYEEERYHRTPLRPKPIMIPVDQPPPPREPIATAVPNGSLGSDREGPTPIRPVYPRTQYNTQYTSTPRVNAGDLPPAGSEDHGNYSSSTMERRKKADKMRKQSGSNPRLTGPTSPESPIYNNIPPIPYEQLQQGSGAISPTPSGLGGGGTPGSEGSKSLTRPLHPLKSFSVPGPPTHVSAPITPVPKHIVRPQQQQPNSPYKKPSAPPATSPVSSKSRSPLPVVTPRAPDVTLKTSPCEESSDLPKSFSTEELTAEMANLEGLMKDLNAITQQEFEC